MRTFRVRVASVLAALGLAVSGALAVATPAAAEAALISLNKPATSSGQNPQLVNDADATNAGGYFDSVLMGGKNAWWQVDLQGVYSLSSIVNRNYVDGSRYYHYYVRGSLDGVHWSAPIAWKFDNTPAAGAGETIAVTGVARYVRVNIVHNSANSSAHLTDFKVYGSPITQSTAPTVSVSAAGTDQASYHTGDTPVLSYTLTNSTQSPVTVQDVHAVVWGLSDRSYRRLSTTESNVVLAGGAVRQHSAPLWSIDPTMPAGAYGVFVRIQLSDGRVWESYQTFFRVAAAGELTTYTVGTQQYNTFPVYTMDGGLSAEYNVLKSAQILSQSDGPSWTTSAPGSGPNPVRATPRFLEQAIDETISTLDSTLGATRQFDTVVLAPGLQPAPYLTRALQAPVLPLHFLVSFDSVYELRTVLDTANRQGYSAFTTFGFDGSMSPGVAWIKLLALPDQYRDYLNRHSVQTVVMTGSSDSEGGENTARKVVWSGSPATGYHAGDMFAVYPGGGTSNDVSQLNSHIPDFSDLPLEAASRQISDWEAGLVPEQVHGFNTGIAASVPTATTRLTFTAGSYYALDNLGIYLMVAFYKKNETALAVGGQVIRGIALNPYLVAHPFFESTQGQLPVLYFQGESATTVVEGRIENAAQTAVNAYFTGINLSTLPVFVNTSHNFGGFANDAIADKLNTRGFTNVTLGDNTIDELWNPSDGYHSLAEKAVLGLDAAKTRGQWTDWNSALTPLDVTDLQTIAARYSEAEVTILGVTQPVGAAPVIVPNTQRWTAALSGGTFTLAGTARIVAADPGLVGTANQLAADLAEVNGMTLSVVNTAALPGDIVLSLTTDHTEWGTEGYRLSVGSTVDIKARAGAGAFYGTRSLLQMLKQDGEARTTISKGKVIDYPKYRERALMLDPARKFLSVAFLKNYIRQMAWLKMNVLHLHLSDDQGFRIESTVPGLTSPQHYTKAEIADLVTFAGRYQVTIIPEIDVPAHATALTNARPDLLHTCPNMRATGALDLTNPNTLPFVKSLLDEFVPLFPVNSFHIGTDEYTYFTKSRANQLLALQSCPEIVAKANQLGYSDPGDIYRDFINQLDTYLGGKGKRTRIWEWYDYVGSKPVNNDIVLDSWLGENDIQGKADAGFDLINSSYKFLYIIPGRSAPDPINLYQNWQPWIWGSAVTERLADPQNPRLLGAKLHVWSDGPDAPAVPEAQIDREISSTLKVFAERIWGGRTRGSYADFLDAAVTVGNVPGYGTDQVLHYRFEPSAPTADASPVGNNGTAYGSTLVAGRNGDAMRFSGGNNRIFVGEPDLAPGWTLSAWLRREASGTDAAALLDSPKFSVRLEQFNTTGKVGLTEYGVADYAFDYVAPIGQWVHLAIVGSTTSTKLYVDGSLTGTINRGFSLPLRYLGATNQSMRGLVDDLIVYRRPLGATAIASLYQNLVIAYGFEDTDAATVSDESGLGNQGGFAGPSRVTGKHGSGLEFHGGDDFLYLAQGDIAGDWTASMWIKRSDPGPAVNVIMNSPMFSVRAAQYGSGRVGVTRYGVSDASFAYTLPADGNWRMLTLVGDERGTSLYIDGQFVETLTASFDLPMRTIGNIVDSLTGVLDDVRVYDRALSDIEIAGLAA
jgi:hexosaminidase